MPTITDARFDSLRASGYTGATNDMLLQWLQFEGAAANNLPDAWQEFLVAKLGITTAEYQRNDAWYAYLGSLGYTGAVNDRELQFWVNRVP